MAMFGGRLHQPGGRVQGNTVHLWLKPGRGWDPAPSLPAKLGHLGLPEEEPCSNLCSKAMPQRNSGGFNSNSARQLF